jgi:hypothetical protein
MAALRVQPAGLQLTRFPYDEALWHVQLVASNGEFSGTHEFYLEKNELSAFGPRLLAFPSSLDHEIKLELGSSGPNAYAYALLRAYVLDGLGHSALECVIQRNGSIDLRATARFSITCEPASLNRLGNELKRWVESSGEPLDWLVDDR